MNRTVRPRRPFRAPRPAQPGASRSAEQPAPAPLSPIALQDGAFQDGNECAARRTAADNNMSDLIHSRAGPTAPAATNPSKATTPKHYITPMNVSSDKSCEPASSLLAITGRRLDTPRRPRHRTTPGQPTSSPCGQRHGISLLLGRATARAAFRPPGLVSSCPGYPGA